MSEVSLMYPVMSKVATDWVKEPKSLYIHGTTGSGKTYFCLALLKQLLERRHCEWVMYVRSHELDDELLKAIEDRQERAALEKYQQVPFLFIDDLGVERNNERVLKQYFSIIDERLGNYLPTVFTSNIAIDNISKTMGDRIASRLSTVTPVKFPDRDLRSL